MFVGMRRQRRLGWLLATALVLIVVDLSARVALVLLDRDRGLRYRPIETTISPEAVDHIRRFAWGRGFLRPDPVLGWTLRPGAVHDGSHASPQGLRGTRVYDTVPPGSGVLRVAAFGDSFVYGDEVADAATWPAQMERPGLEVLNFGVPAYGLDQAFLRYLRDGRVFRPRVVLIGIYAEQVNRDLNVWRPFMTSEYGIPSAKPRFHLNDSLVLDSNPLPSAAAYHGLIVQPESVLAVLGITDHFYHARERASAWDVLASVRLAKLTWRIWHEHREGTLRDDVLRGRGAGSRLAVAVLRQFVTRVRADGAEPVLIGFPDAYLFDRYRRSGERAEAVLLAALPDVPAVDLYPVLSSRDFAPFGHYTPLGNRKVAEEIVSYLLHLQSASRRPDAGPAR